MTNLQLTLQNEREQIRKNLDTIENSLNDVCKILESANLPHAIEDVVRAVQCPDHFREDAEKSLSEWSAAVNLPTYLYGAFATMAQKAAIPDAALLTIQAAARDLDYLPEYEARHFTLKSQRIVFTSSKRSREYERAVYTFSEEQEQDIRSISRLLILRQELSPYVDDARLFGDICKGLDVDPSRYARRDNLSVDNEKVAELSGLFRTLSERVHIKRYLNEATQNVGWGFVVDDILPVYHYQEVVIGR